MTDSTPPVSAPPTHSRTPRARWHLIVVCGVLAVILALCAHWYIAASNARYRVVGKIDPKTGYRIEYTVSTRYHKTDDKLLNPTAYADELEACEFRPAEANPILHLLKAQSHSQQTPLSALDDAESIALYQYAQSVDVPAGASMDNNGYVTMDLAGTGLGKPVLQQRITVSSCPATWSVYDVHTPQPYGAYRAFVLLIKPKRQPVIYELYGTSIGARYNLAAEEELKKIMASIHIVKVK